MGSMQEGHWAAREARIIVPCRRDEVTEDDLDGEAMLSDPHNGSTHHLNPTASAVWRACDGQLTTRQIAEMLTEAYDVDFETALDQVEQLIVVFSESQLLQLAEKV